MTTEKIEGYKAELEKERIKLLAEIKEEETPKSFGDDVDDFEEETDATEEYSNNLAMAGDLKKRLDEIDIALSKIKNGGYGMCEKCGSEIGEEVLSINPEARICKNCG